jgi:hemerythrin-like domain-containing protein
VEAEEVRERILQEHAELRGMLDEVHSLAERFEGGDAQVSQTLRERGLRLYERFAAHLDLEDRLLAPALRKAGGPGPERAERLAREHREQRELLDYLMERLLKHPAPTLLVARELHHFVSYVRLDMDYEEETLLGGILDRGQRDLSPVMRAPRSR